MRIAVTGATGFLGRYLVENLLADGAQLRCWARTARGAATARFTHPNLEWIPGELACSTSTRRLVEGCDALVHAALDRPGSAFQGQEGNIIEFVEKNLIGTLQLIEAARVSRVSRCIIISTCAVHDRILDDRPLDETHPLWATSHYGACKGAIEKFVHSYGYGHGYPICALRPTGIYGLAQPAEKSKWFRLIRAIVENEPVVCRRGGKEVHAADVAKAVGILLHADSIAGECFNCYDRYVSEFDVAQIAQGLVHSRSTIDGQPMAPRHQIETRKLRDLGMAFGGEDRLVATVRELVDAVHRNLEQRSRPG